MCCLPPQRNLTSGLVSLSIDANEHCIINLDGSLGTTDGFEPFLRGTSMNVSDSLRGAGLMTLSMFGFVLNDTAIKYGGTDIGIFQSIFVRGIFAIALVAALFALTNEKLSLPSKRDFGLVSLRTLTEIGATLTFLTGLFNMPLANITSMLQLTPLAMALAAALFLKERVTLWRGVAIGVGFLGALLVIQPGSQAFNFYGLFGLAAVAFSVWRDLIVRKLSDHTSSLFVTFVATIGITAAGGCGCLLFSTWVPLGLSDIAILALSAVFLIVGYFCAVAAMRLGDVAFVSSFRYTVMIWAIVLGWLVFGSVPEGLTIAGIALLVAGGLLVVWSGKQDKSVKEAAR